MKIDTLYFGEVEVKEESILIFESGLPGFQDEKKFTIIKLPDNPVFQILQSVSTKDLSFVITVPYLYYKDYDFELDEGTINQLGIEQPNDVSVFSIVTLQDSLDNSTLNLQAPIVTNVKNKKAKQMVLNDKKYKTKHPLQLEGEVEEHASTNTKNR